jgi:transcriptional regulator with XRE-family HTH domain
MLQPSNTPTPPEADTQDARAPAKGPERTVALNPEWRAGRKLTEARQQLGLSIEDIADRIRVRREFLEALEQMNIKLLPGKAYALAFLRSYARELGIDEKAIVDQFQDECALTREDAQAQIRNPASRPRRERPWMIAAALVVLAAAFVGWRALSQNNTEQVAEAPVIVGQSRPGSAVSPAPPTVEARVVEIRAVTEGWLEARGPDGTVFLSRVLQPGDVYRPDPSPGWTLHARDGGAFELFVNGQAAGLLGTPGMPVLGRSIDDIEPIAQASVAPSRS